MRFLYILIFCFLICVATEADPYSSTADSDYTDQYAHKIEVSRKTGYWNVDTNGHLFQLANLFFPDRPVASVKFIQDVVKLNSGYFINGEMRSLVQGIVLRLPGYVMLATDTVPAEIVTQETMLSAEDIDNDTPVDAAISTTINKTTESSVVQSTNQPTNSATDSATDLSIEAKQKYVDQYMEISDLEELDKILRKQPAGRRSLETEYYYYNNEGSGYNSIEHGVNLGFKRETLQSGNLFIKSSFQHFNTETLQNNTDGHDWLVKLEQTDMPLGNTWLMDNTLGQQRSLPDSLLFGGYRYRLPGSPLTGISGRLRSDDTQYKWYAGNTGDYEGVSSRRFAEDGGKTAALFMQHDLSSSLRVGGVLSTLNNHDQIEDHNSMLGAFSFQTAEAQHNLRILMNGDGNIAAWNDNSHGNISGWRVRYGVFHAEPELKWNDSAIASDQQGIYAQASSRKQNTELSLGYDYQKFGLGNNSLSSSSNHSVFANGLYRVNRTVNTGTTTSFSSRSFDILSGSNNQQNNFSISQFIKARSLSGVMALELFYSKTDSTDRTNNSYSQGLNLRKDWQLPLHQDLELEFRVEQTNSELQSDTKTIQTNLHYSNDWQDNLSWAIGLTAFQNQSDSGGGITNHNTGVHVGLSGYWQITPRWHSRMNFDSGHTTIPGSDPFIAGDRETKTISITLGYSHHKGRPFQYFGRRSESNATGKIKGIVFFDENRDGIRQHNEKLAKDVRIILDGKFEVLTDHEGEYEYLPVYVGMHSIEIVIEDLPLPWTLEDESSISIRVDNRKTTKTNFALIKI